jgi:hypothetical protein
MTEDAPNHRGIFDERDQLEPVAAARTLEHIEAETRCISSAHNRFVRVGTGGRLRTDESTAIVP